MATLRISIDRQTRQIIKEEIIPSDFIVNKSAFFDKLAQIYIETKGIDFFKNLEAKNELSSVSASISK